MPLAPSECEARQEEASRALVVAFYTPIFNVPAIKQSLTGLEDEPGQIEPCLVDLEGQPLSW